MKKDSHGGNIYKAAKELGIKEQDLLDFSANISPLGVPKEIREAMVEALDGIHNYPDPDCTDLREAIAASDHVKKEQITCGNGGADLLYRIAFGLQPKKVLLPVPAFVEYEEAMTAAGAEMVYYKMDHTLLPKEDFYDEITEAIDLVIFCNPNNPTGLLMDRDYIEKALAKAKEVGAMVLLDECFLEICTEEKEYTLKPLVEKWDNLMILKSFTKLYAIPGVRLGYLICGNQKVIEQVNHTGQAWSVSHIAQKTGVAALQLKEYKEAVIRTVAEELAYMKQELGKLPIELYDGHANYLFFRAPGITDLDQKLFTRGIMIRNCSNYVNLGKDYWRIAVKSHKENEVLCNALQEIIQ